MSTHCAANAERNLDIDMKSFLFHLEYLFPFDMLDLQYIQVEIKQKLLLILLNLNLSQISTIKLNSAISCFPDVRGEWIYNRTLHTFHVD